MSKRTVFTTISPLPAGVSRQIVLAFLHSHVDMIDLNPLVKERHPIDPPSQYPDEKNCAWYSLTDKIDYLPGGKISGDVSYTCAFHDLRNGLSTHCRAAMGVDIREKWTVCGTLPGEPREPVELGIGAPSSGLYLREDCDLRCNILMTSFVKKNLKKSHAALVQRLVEKSQILSSSDFGSTTADDKTLAMPWALSELPLASPSSSLSSLQPSSPPHFARPASFSGHPAAQREGTPSPPPPAAVNACAEAQQPSIPFPSFYGEQQRFHSRERGRSSPAPPTYRPYSQHGNHNQQPAPMQVPFALRVGPPPPPLSYAQRADSSGFNNDAPPYPSYCSMPEPLKSVDPALYPTPLRIRGLSTGSITTVGSSDSTMRGHFNNTPSPSTTLTHHSSVHSTTSCYASATVPSRIIAPQEQHPDYPVLNPYAGRSSANTSGESSPADERQPDTPKFPGMGYGRGDNVEHPDVLRPGVGAKMSSRLNGPFLTDWTAELA